MCVIAASGSRREPVQTRLFCDQHSDYKSCALRYAVSTEAETLPRPLTVIPLSRAQERTSALLGDRANRTAVHCFGFRATASLARAAGRVFLAAVGLLPALISAGFLTSCSTPATSALSLATTSVTPYNAPRTRIASSRGSLESTVSFTSVPFDMFATRRIRSQELRNGKQGASPRANTRHVAGSNDGPSSSVNPKARPFRRVKAPRKVLVPTRAAD
jgi:hypothetical protein